MLRFPVEPMNATLGSLPGEADDDHWAYEIKWDGYRTIAFVDDGTLRLQSRRLLDVTAKYPEVAGLPGDGERRPGGARRRDRLLRRTGRPSFEALQRHDTRRCSTSSTSSPSTPPTPIGAALRGRAATCWPRSGRAGLELARAGTPHRRRCRPARGDRRARPGGRDGQAPRLDLHRRAGAPRSGARSRTGSAPRS